MGISLYAASVGSYLQILPAMSALLDKASDHFGSEGVDLGEITEARLHTDMLPLRFQVLSIAHHSSGTVESMRSGTFGPPKYDASLDFRALQDLLVSTTDELKALSEEDINAFSGGAIKFVMGDLQLPFSTENFVLSFSLPNFYFHASTLYDLLRNKGLPLSKRDFMGKLHITR